MKKCLSILFILAAITANAQFGLTLKNPLTLVQGDVSILKGQKSINVVVMKDKLHVEDMTESQYIQKTTKEKNSAKSGSGQAWAKEWNGNFTEYNNALRTGFEKKSKMTVKKGSKYTILFKINKIVIGWDAGVAGKSANISGTVYVYETAKSNKILAKYNLEKSIGGEGFTIKDRITWCYIMTGRRMAKAIEKS